jgi:hypothetical protein
VNFSKELWSWFVIMVGKSADCALAARSGSNKTLHYEKSGKVTGKNRLAYRTSLSLTVALKN